MTKKDKPSRSMKAMIETAKDLKRAGVMDTNTYEKLSEAYGDLGLINTKTKLIKKIIRFLEIKCYDPIERIVQKIIRGFADYDLYDLDVTIAEFILPRLKRYKKLNTGYSLEKWNQDIDDMILAFQTIIEIGNSNDDRVKNGLDKFMKNFYRLWI